jgi:2'-5' RNA ligase
MPAAAGGSADAATGRVVAEVDLHVTLCFLGAVEESRLEPLCQRVSEVQAAPFELEFDAFEYWRRARALVATASRAPSAAVALAATLCAAARALGLSADERVLRPHVTLVRGLAGTRTAGEPAAPHPEAPPPGTLPCKPPLPLVARRFHLAQSHELEAATATAPQAGRYSQLASWPLTTPAR